MPEGLDLEVGDGLPRNLGDGHAEDDGVNEGADDDVLAELGLLLGVARVDVEGVVVHGLHAVEDVVVLGDGASGPVLEHVADLELLVVATEVFAPVVDSHIWLLAVGCWFPPAPPRTR